jgi:hypothetical protein
MRERPILFSAPMVRAILAGQKTQTRRMVKPQPQHPSFGSRKMLALDDEGIDLYLHGGPLLPWAIRCPYGRDGDRLWARETWRVGAWRGPMHDRSSDHWVALDYQADGHARREWLSCGADDRLERQSLADAHRAGRIEVDGRFEWEPGQSPCRWRPSIHMPRWASRLTLEVTDVRVERLQSISEDDARAEGVDYDPGEGGVFWVPGLGCASDSAAESFRLLWTSINGAESWNANPWVWVITFKRIDA